MSLEIIDPISGLPVENYHQGLFAKNNLEEIQEKANIVYLLERNQDGWEAYPVDNNFYIPMSSVSEIIHEFDYALELALERNKRFEKNQIILESIKNNSNLVEIAVEVV